MKSLLVKSINFDFMSCLTPAEIIVRKVEIVLRVMTEVILRAAREGVSFDKVDIHIELENEHWDYQYKVTLEESHGG